MQCPKCGSNNTVKSEWLDSYSCNDCPDPNTWTRWQQAEIDLLRGLLKRLQYGYEISIGVPHTAKKCIRCGKFYAEGCKPGCVLQAALEG